MAVAVGAVVYLVGAWDIPHGYWMALTLTVVLRPFDDQTRRKSLQRVVGTIGGVVLSLLLAARPADLGQSRSPSPCAW